MTALEFLGIAACGVVGGMAMLSVAILGGFSGWWERFPGREQSALLLLPALGVVAGLLAGWSLR